MKTLILVFISTVFGVNIIFAQAIKPTIMVVPSDAWCNIHGCMMEFNNQGTISKVPDYKKAFQENPDLLLAISSINELMAERGFTLKNLESALKTLEEDQAEDNTMMSKEGGAEMAETPYDQLKKVAKADFIIQLTWTLNTTGPKKSITFILQGLDSYTDKQIAGSSGTGAPSFSSEVQVLLKEAVLSHMDNFCATLMDCFIDWQEKGREIVLRIRIWDDWEYDLESEFPPDEEELGFLIEDWLAENTVNGSFNTIDATETMMLFEQVRIPLSYERNGRPRALDARRYASFLKKFLKNDPFNIDSKLTMKGVGRATLTLGHK